MGFRWTAVVAVLIVLAGCGTDDRSTPTGAHPASPPRTTTAAEPVGPRSQIPWWSNGSLHVSGRTIPTRMRQLTARGGTTIVGRATSRGSTWKIVRGEQLVDLFSTHSPGSRPVLSANGRFVAWTTSAVSRRINEFEADTAFTVTAYDVRRGTVSGTTSVESHTFCCDGGGVVEVAGVDNDGAVVVARYGYEAWIWRAGADPVELSGTVRSPRVTGNDPWPGGVSWTVGEGSSDDPAAFGRAASDGAVMRVGRVPQSQDGLWSPDGSSYAFVPFTKVGHRRPVVWSAGTRVRLQLRHAADIVGWESTHELILLTEGRPGRPALRPAVLARCDSRTGTCEQAGPPIPDAHLAASRLL